jgi:H+-transporting ATPase
LPKIWFISVILGFLLALGTWVIRGTLFLPNGGIIQNFGAIQPILFLEVALTENWLIFVTRGGKTFPSFQLVFAILAVDALATIFCVFGWMSGSNYQTDPPTHNSKFREDGWVDIVTVVVIWGYSIGVTIIIAIVYFLLNRIPWLDTLGRKDRNKKNPGIENMIAALSKLSLEHGVDKHGTTRYVLAPRAVEEEDDD